MAFSSEGVLDANVEVAFFVVISVLIVPCVVVNCIVLLRLLKNSNYNLLKIRPKTMNLFFNLAICDLLMGLVPMPWSLYYIKIGRPTPNDNSTLHSTYNSNREHRLFCSMSGFIYNVITRVTSLVLLVLSIDRTHAIYYPLTYAKSIYNAVYAYCIYIIWLFAIGLSALPFLAGIPYIEQPTGELMCSWSVTELLKLSQQEIMDNTYQIFPLYFILVVLPLIIPTAISVILSFAVLIRILVKRHRYVADRMRTSTLTVASGSSNSYKSRILIFLARIREFFSISNDNPKIRSLSRASITMMLLVSVYFVLFSYWWVLAIVNTLTLLGVQVNIFYQRMQSSMHRYINNSQPIIVFFHALISPMIVYFRVIQNLSGQSRGLTSMNSLTQQVQSKNKTWTRITAISNSYVITLKKRFHFRRRSGEVRFTAPTKATKYLPSAIDSHEA